MLQEEQEKKEESDSAKKIVYLTLKEIRGLFGEEEASTSGKYHRKRDDDGSVFEAVTITPAISNAETHDDELGTSVEEHENETEACIESEEEDQEGGEKMTMDIHTKLKTPTSEKKARSQMAVSRKDNLEETILLDDDSVEGLSEEEEMEIKEETKTMFLSGKESAVSSTVNVGQRDNGTTILDDEDSSEDEEEEEELHTHIKVKPESKSPVSSHKSVFIEGEIEESESDEEEEDEEISKDKENTKKSPTSPSKVEQALKNEGLILIDDSDDSESESEEETPKGVKLGQKLITSPSHKELITSPSSFKKLQSVPFSPVVDKIKEQKNANLEEDVSEESESEDEAEIKETKFSTAQSPPKACVTAKFVSKSPSKPASKVIVDESSSSDSSDLDSEEETKSTGKKIVADAESIDITEVVISDSDSHVDSEPETSKPGLEQCEEGDAGSKLKDGTTSPSKVVNGSPNTDTGKDSLDEMKVLGSESSKGQSTYEEEELDSDALLVETSEFDEETESECTVLYVNSPTVASCDNISTSTEKSPHSSRKIVAERFPKVVSLSPLKSAKKQPAAKINIKNTPKQQKISASSLSADEKPLDETMELSPAVSPKKSRKSESSIDEDKKKKKENRRRTLHVDTSQKLLEETRSFPPLQRVGTPRPKKRLSSETELRLRTSFSGREEMEKGLHSVHETELSYETVNKSDTQKNQSSNSFPSGNKRRRLSSSVTDEKQPDLSIKDHSSPEKRKEDVISPTDGGRKENSRTPRKSSEDESVSPHKRISQDKYEESVKSPSKRRESDKSEDGIKTRGLVSPRRSIGKSSIVETIDEIKEITSEDRQQAESVTPRRKSSHDDGEPLKTPSSSKGASPIKTPKSLKKSSDNDDEPLKTPSSSKGASPIKTPKSLKKSSDNDDEPLKTPSSSKGASPIKTPKSLKKSSDKDDEPLKTPSSSKGASPIKTPKSLKKSSDNDDEPLKTPSSSKSASPIKTPKSLKKSSDNDVEPLKTPSSSNGTSPIKMPKQQTMTPPSKPIETEQKLLKTPRKTPKKTPRKSSKQSSDEDLATNKEETTPCTEILSGSEEDKTKSRLRSPKNQNSKYAVTKKDTEKDNRKLDETFEFLIVLQKKNCPRKARNQSKVVNLLVPQSQLDRLK